jgi:dynein heavy chain
MDAKLEVIQKALDEYLEKKRMQFPRFYFLSNDDLLEILGQSKDPFAVQAHIKKCFEGINSLQLIAPGEQGNRTFEALGMNSPDGEKVTWERKLVVEGAVELWLIEVEKCMKWALQKISALCIPAAKGKDKLKWIKEYPGQLLITTGMIFFVLNCEKQLRSDQPLKNLKTTRKRQVLLLNKLAEIVRAPLGKVDRKKTVALITMELHTRDVMERMIKAQCSSTDDFEWLSQLRLEFQKGEGLYGIILAKQTKSTLEFGYEYQGNNGRLVVTPLTDRCVLTITTALYMQRGGAPAGPAGTGKTETVKDLGKNLAKFVVVFNCSDQLDYKSIGRMFSGLVQSGGWGCVSSSSRRPSLSPPAPGFLTLRSALPSSLSPLLLHLSPTPPPPSPLASSTSSTASRWRCSPSWRSRCWPSSRPSRPRSPSSSSWTSSSAATRSAASSSP